MENECPAKRSLCGIPRICPHTLLYDGKSDNVRNQREDGQTEREWRRSAM